MVKVDEFASIFRAAEREPFAYQSPKLSRVTLVTDRDHESAEETRAAVAAFLPALADAEWSTITVDEHAGSGAHAGSGEATSVAAVAEAVRASQPNVVVAFRHLGESSLVPQHSLGVYLDVLTQVLPQPVLVLPGTAADRVPLDEVSRSGTAASVMVVTDHIRGEQRLIGFAAGVAPARSTLWLCHVEDDAMFQRYLNAIGQIPEIDTDLARVQIARVLTSEAHEYLEAAKAGLEKAALDLTVVPHLSQGHRFKTFLDLVQSHDVDLLVVNTKDDEQLAMHGTAYALAVELIRTPLLLL